jgi:hypothetical protein
LILTVKEANFSMQDQVSLAFKWTDFECSKTKQPFHVLLIEFNNSLIFF